MAVAYPDYPQQLSSDMQWIDDRRFERSAAGTGRGRSFYTAKKRRFVVRHVLTDAQLADYETFYDTNRDEELLFSWCRDPDATPPWLVAYETVPQISTDENGHVTVQVVLAEI